MKLEFHGADQNVTGFCHLFETAGKKILIDCEPYQGGREMDEENLEPFGFIPARYRLSFVNSCPPGSLRANTFAG
jgi:metallo-beta-lactamase family protein